VAKNVTADEPNTLRVTVAGVYRVNMSIYFTGHSIENGLFAKLRCDTTDLNWLIERTRSLNYLENIHETVIAELPAGGLISLWLSASIVDQPGDFKIMNSSISVELIG
jgi:hypothetical protein